MPLQVNTIGFNEVIKKALSILATKENYAYFYGAKGIKLTDANMDYLIKTEPNHFARYSAEDLQRIKDYSRNKIGYDCSGFITAITGTVGNSTTQWSKCVKNASPALGFAGSILWKPGHIGIDIGYGKFLHFPSEGHTCEMGTIAEFPWEASGEMTNINYWGASNV